ncbi:hypothetical protein EI42_00868 [Thermosporothrix hazakensis]|jgi:hypothetical protein|uniref:Uncharacterized protein n=2 Tax=Thermosporothrix TaxID=768650 RepID=A0A326UE22_THEHA|nr:hypothetical protein [Thermosporothrix hazakensis]PZW36687.1 hypothetical protein EI42_00868 [Thermosporothrix hazakensis]BBH89155.1 hypothetical protein KTC_39060 [Thermosporothrix sp. COM3]GCE47338.1 hypothetical protein KTH_22070 [Thermosporothrix hazakensis]
MNTLLIYLPPIINVVVTAIFAGTVIKQYLQKHRANQLYWSIGLSMAVVATLAYICMLLVQPTSATGMLLYRIYYIFGAAIMPAWLGLGSIALVSGPRVTRTCLLILSFLSLICIAFILDATIDVTHLAAIAGTPGSGVLRPGPWLVMIILLNSLGVVAVVGVAIYSGWKLIRHQTNIKGMRTANLLWANLLILLGDLLNAAAGSLARFGIQSTFWLIMAVGWIVFFSGVVLASRRPRPAPTAQVSHTS